MKRLKVRSAAFSMRGRGRLCRGITSAAMDGIKVAEELIRRYRPLKEKTGELEG